jgi:hypothetical protein
VDVQIASHCGKVSQKDFSNLLRDVEYSVTIACYQLNTNRLTNEGVKR